MRSKSAHRPPIQDRLFSCCDSTWGFIQDLFTLSIKEEKEVQEIPPAEQLVLMVPSSVADWREQFIKYLASVEVPSDKTKTEHLIRRSKYYVLVDDNLMRKSVKEGIL